MGTIDFEIMRKEISAIPLVTYFKHTVNKHNDSSSVPVVSLKFNNLFNPNVFNVATCCIQQLRSHHKFFTIFHTNEQK